MDDLIRMNPPTISKARRWAALAVVLFGQFVVSIDMTVLNIALPDLTAELQPTSDQQLWIIDVYSLVLAGLLVTASSLSDRWGRKRMMLAGFAVFGIGSGLIMFADSTEAVIALRALLGVGAAMIMPTTISMVRSIFLDAKERAFALAGWSAIGGLGMAAPALAMRFGARNVTAAGLAIGAVAMIMLIAFHGNLTYVPVMISSSLVGLGTGALAVGSSVIMCETPVEKASSAASLEEISYDLGNVLGVAILGSVASIVYRLGLDPAALAESGLSGAAIDEAMQSFGAAAQIAQQTGAAELLREGAASFSESIIITSFAGGVVLLAVSIVVWKLIPRDLDIAESGH